MDKQTNAQHLDTLGSCWSQKKVCTYPASLETMWARVSLINGSWKLFDLNVALSLNSLSSQMAPALFSAHTQAPSWYQGHGLIPVWLDLKAATLITISQKNPEPWTYRIESIISRQSNPCLCCLSVCLVYCPSFIREGFLDSHHLLFEINTLYRC